MFHLLRESFLLEFIDVWGFTPLQLCNNSFNLKWLGSDTNDPAVIISIWLLSLALCTFNSWEQKFILSPAQNITGICKNSTVLTFYELSSRSVKFFEFIYFCVWGPNFHFHVYFASQIPPNCTFVFLVYSHQPLVSAGDVNLLGDNTDTIKKNTQNFNWR
jgi:hypothetical protein